MAYTIQKLARLSGVSARTLRYYDQIGLLRPGRMADNGYRVYEQPQVDRLQQILFYRELGVGLEQIRSILDAQGFDRRAALEKHLSELTRERSRLDALMVNVRKTLLAMEGEGTMTDTEKFEGFKREMIDKNEREYGAELRERYGEKEIEESNRRLAGMSEEQWQRQQALEKEIAALLATAAQAGDPASEDAQKLCGLHREWLSLFWRKGGYSKQMHMALGESYVADERFKAYYDNITPGGAEFLRDALKVYCAE